MGTSLLEPGPTTTLHNVSWQTYESLLRDYSEFSGVHVNYDRGVMEIMTPGPEHENFNRQIETMMLAIGEEQERDMEPYGSMTFKRADLERGFEPDSCFYIEHAAQMRGKSVIDLAIDPAPELVVEVDDTSPSLNKLPLYASIGVREVWRYKDGKITIYGIDERNVGQYQEREYSIAFPELNGLQIEEFMSQARTSRRPEWMRGIREWARQAKAQTTPEE
jgi:Uma2 family endonuclease